MSRKPIIQRYINSNLITFKARLFNLFNLSDITKYNYLIFELKNIEIFENLNLYSSCNYKKNVLILVYRVSININDYT